MDSPTKDGEVAAQVSRLASAVHALLTQFRELSYSVQEVRNISAACLKAQQAAANAGEPNATIGYFTLKEIADLFRVHRKTIERWIRDEGLPCLLVGGLKRFALGDVLRWAATRGRSVQS